VIHQGAGVIPLGDRPAHWNALSAENWAASGPRASASNGLAQTQALARSLWERACPANTGESPCHPRPLAHGLIVRGCCAAQPANQSPDPEAPRSGQHLPKHFHTRSIRLHHHACRQFPNPTHFDPLPLRRRSHGTRVSRILSATASSPAYLQEQPKKGDVRTSSRSAQFLPRSR